MKKVLLIISLILVVPTIKAQVEIGRLNELNKQLLGKGEDSSKVNVFLAYFDYYLHEADNNKRDSTFFYLYKAYNLSKKLNYVNGIKKSLLFLGLEYDRIMDYVNGVKVSTEYLTLSEATKDTLEIISALEAKGDFYSQAKDYDNELKFSKILDSISFNYYLSHHGTYDSILKRFWDHGTDFYLTTLARVGKAFLNLNKLDSALIYFQKHYELAFSNNYSQVLSNSNMGLINYKIGEYETALPYYKKALQLSYSGLQGYGVNIRLGLAKTFDKLGKKDSALIYSKAAYKISREENSTENILNSSENLFLLYKAYKNNDSAIFYQSIYVSSKDSLFNQDRVRLLEKYTVAEEVRLNEISEQKIHEQEERKRNIKLGLIAIFIPVFASMVYLISRKKKKNTKFVSLMGLASLLMLFEFISLLLHPYIEKFTNHDAIFMYLILLLIASLLVPLHHKLEGWVKTKI